MRRWLWFIGCFIFISATASAWFYHSLNMEFDSAGNEAVNRALAQSSLVTVDHVEFFAGAVDYVVVFGNNTDGEPLLVWVGDEDLHEEKAADVTREEIRFQVLESHGPVDIIRVTPGKLQEDYVWEVFFKKKEENGVRHYYEYYTYTDGEWLDTYRLSLQ